ncbi:MAG: hypothetical protein P8N02_14675 [Actinomycetota bacterium]|jgi:hypothetical protein|nr:hypothetical protein [Actinomycetota bacterium]
MGWLIVLAAVMALLPGSVVGAVGSHFSGDGYVPLVDSGVRMTERLGSEVRVVSRRAT